MAADFPRDRWGRPLIVPDGGGKQVAYGRFSSHGSVLEEKFALEKWKIRTSAIGLTKRDDLFAQLAACPTEDTSRLDEILAQALEAGGGSIGANLGTALHEFTQRIDLGEITLDDIAEPWKSDVQAYLQALSTHHFSVVKELIEVNLVNDELMLAGTADRFYSTKFGTVCADIKTGKQISKNPLAYAVQLAGYANSFLYNVDTGERRQIAEDIELRIGYIIHIPANQGRCDIYEVDLQEAMAAARLASTVKRWQKRQDLVRKVEPLVQPKTVQTAPAFDRNSWLHARIKPLIEICKSELNALWPAGIPTPKSGTTIWTDQQIDEIIKTVETLETIHELPFFEKDPAIQPASNRQPKPEPIDEGGIEDDIIIIGIRHRLATLEKPQLDFVQSIISEATQGKVSFNLKQKKTVRRARITDAIITLSHLASGDNADIELIRTIVGEIRQDLPDKPLGHIIGTFTTEEATSLEQFAQKIIAGETVITFNDDGSITFKEEK